MGELVRTTVAIERSLLETFDTWMAAHGYTNRSEAVRDIIRSVMTEAECKDPKAKVVGVLSIVYDHGTRSLGQELAHIQHEGHEEVLCSQHVHLDQHKCLEVILMQGPAGELRNLADTILATRGVKVGKLTLLTNNL